MQKVLLLTLITVYSAAWSQDLSREAEQFIQTLDSAQRLKTLFPFASDDR